MTVLERIKETARSKKNLSLTALEQELGYSNGSLAKAKDLPSSRVMEISNFLEVSMDYLMTGNDYDFIVEMAETDVALSNMNKRMKEYALKLSELSKENQDLIMQMIDKLQ